MRRLVIETSGSACSVALFANGRPVAHSHEIVGRGHAERLLPMIAALPDGGRAGEILVDCGPGSFTGIRVGLAAATGLGIGWAARVVGYSSLGLMAALSARTGPFVVTTGAGHGEIFFQEFDSALVPASTVASLKPEVARSTADGRIVISVDILRAVDTAVFPDDHAFLPPIPIYGRGADARLPA